SDRTARAQAASGKTGVERRAGIPLWHDHPGADRGADRAGDRGAGARLSSPITLIPGAANQPSPQVLLPSGPVRQPVITYVGVRARLGAAPGGVAGIPPVRNKRCV